MTNLPTPGPWKLRKRDDGTGDDDYLGWDWDWDYPHNPPGAMRGLFSKMADARLVEAAPKMYELLVELAEVVSHTEAQMDTAGIDIDGLVELRNWWERADEIVSKVRGEQP